jgi:hypothetical protein
MLTLYALLTLLLVVGLLLIRPLPAWRAKAERFTKDVLPRIVNITASGKYASSDHLLTALELQQPSETLVALMAELAPDETTLFVGPADDPLFMQNLLTFSYLSWPHQLAALGCRVGAAPQVLYRPRAGVRVARAFFYVQAPPSRLAAGSRVLSPKLKLLQVAKGEEWTSYCSQ